MNGRRREKREGDGEGANRGKKREERGKDKRGRGRKGEKGWSVNGKRGKEREEIGVKERREGEKVGEERKQEKKGEVRTESGLLFHVKFQLDWYSCGAKDRQNAVKFGRIFNWELPCHPFNDQSHGATLPRQISF